MTQRRPDTPERSGEPPQQHLAKFMGVLQSDAFAGDVELYVGGEFRGACLPGIRTPKAERSARYSANAEGIAYLISSEMGSCEISCPRPLAGQKSRI
jgi:hypothetical protein